MKEGLEVTRGSTPGAPHRAPLFLLQGTSPARAEQSCPFIIPPPFTEYLFAC